MQLKIVATVLAHDAGPSLGRVLEGLAHQSRAPDGVIVLDNGGREETTAALAARYGVRLLRSPENLGVGGGHGKLFRAALEDPDVTHVWALEHDSYATPNCLAAILDAQDALVRRNQRLGAVYAHLERNEAEAEAHAGDLAGPWSVGSRFTFNGVLFARHVIEHVGLPREDFFVGNEDWEYAARLRRAGFEIYEASAALMLHPTKGNQRFNVRPNVFRSYYSTRNWMRIRIEERPLSGAVRSCAWCVASLGSIVLRDDQKLKRTAARLAATRDALLNRMGPRRYWFLD